ncbi:MAG: 4'-phosphopantetheinyl transferase superfamily protein [Candidatus Binatia bacterium]
MIGNDIVDLDDPESRPASRHPRFDARAFATEERALIAASTDAERTRWTLWAAKESAYKVARQHAPATVFAPSRFLVRLEDAGQATVRVGDRRFDVRIAFGAGHVHAVACGAEDPPEALCAAVAELPPGAPPASTAVRRLAIATLAHALRISPDDLTIHRDRRVPTLWLRGRPSPAALSLSHHGRFVAFACAVSPSPKRT